MRLTLIVLAVLLNSVFAQRAFAEIDGEAFVMPSERISADLLLRDPRYQNVTAAELPIKFWKRQRRNELVKLVERFGIASTLRQLETVLPDGQGSAQFFAEDGDFLLVTDVVPTANGPHFKTAFDGWFKPESFKFSQTSLDVLRRQSQHTVDKLRMGATLANLGQEDLFSLTRFYFPHMERFAAGGNQEDVVEMIRQSITNLLLQLEKNEKDAPTGNLWSERDALTTMVFYNAGRLSRYFGDWLAIAGPTADATPLIAFAAENITQHRFETMLKAGQGSEAVRYLLGSGWCNFLVIAKLLEAAVNDYGLSIFGDAEWEQLGKMPVLQPFESLLISGIVLGTLNSDTFSSKFNVDHLVRKQAYEAVWIGQTPEAINAVAQPLNWIALSHPSVMFPSRLLKLLASDPKASYIARDCLLKHMLLVGDRHYLLPWFFNLFAAGKAQFHVRAGLKQQLIDADAEIGFLAFPEAFDGRPPVSFTKSTLMGLVKAGAVDGTLRSVSSILVKLVELRMGAMNPGELYATMEWARKSRLSYALGIKIISVLFLHFAIGKQLYQLLRKDDEMPTQMKRTAVGVEEVREWEGFPFGPDGEFTLETYHAIFTWIPFELDAEIMQKFELFSTQLDEVDIAFLLKATPARLRVMQILKRQYMLITTRHVGAVFRFEDVLKEHANDAVWLVDLARRQWDPSDLSTVRDVFLAHGFAESVWRLIRFTPQDQVSEYLGAIKRFSNVPFPFLEHLRVERGMTPVQIIAYVEENVADPEIR